MARHDWQRQIRGRTLLPTLLLGLPGEKLLLFKLTVDAAGRPVPLLLVMDVLSP